MGFMNDLHNSFFNSANLGFSSVCPLTGVFMLLHDATNNTWSLHFCVSYTVNDPMLYEAMTTLWLSSLSNLLII